ANPITVGPLNIIKPCYTLKSTVLFFKTLDKGHGISYNRSYITKDFTRVVTLPIGYGDGYPRTAQGDMAVVRIVDQFVPVIGRVSMDMLLVDLTDLTYAVPNGTSVCLWGVSPSVDQIAAAAGTLGYELLCRMTQRPIRHYIA
ncbi:MAG: alanine racemase, partial [Flavobacteriales bacterium]